MNSTLLIQSIKHAAKVKILFSVFLLIGLFSSPQIFARTKTRTLSGAVLTQQFELVPNVSILVETSNGKLSGVTSAEGAFSLQAPNESFSVKFLAAVFSR